MGHLSGRRFLNVELFLVIIAFSEKLWCVPALRSIESLHHHDAGSASALLLPCLKHQWSDSERLFKAHCRARWSDFHI